MNPDPWGVMVSEFMLQQTPVKRVLPAWQSWMATWPTPADLAQASPADAIRMWANLGYPRRAVRLHQSAQVITTEYNNQVPNTFDQLINLPGVGEYTANAILAFAFNQPTLVVDINVRRVISRAWLGQAHPANSLSAVERAFAQTLIPKNPQRAPMWAAASMELGALICTARDPECSQCPIRRSCAWFTSGQPNNASKPRTQAKYEGSDRQERGRILRELRASNYSVPIKQIMKNAKDVQQCERALESLRQEKLIIDVPRKRVSLPEN
jgi:A/G-specific adenine glycosylase